jgi:hypothetical protein
MEYPATGLGKEKEKRKGRSPAESQAGKFLLAIIISAHHARCHVLRGI